MLAIQGFKTVGDVRSASNKTLLSLPDLGPRSVAQLRAKLDGPGFLDVECVVVEEEFLHVREELLGVRHLGRYVIGRALAPGMA